jgi:prepilin-type N-terminal cleavage/methylation domain-containing protein
MFVEVRPILNRASAASISADAAFPARPFPNRMWINDGHSVGQSIPSSGSIHMGVVICQGNPSANESVIFDNMPVDPAIPSRMKVFPSFPMPCRRASSRCRSKEGGALYRSVDLMMRETNRRAAYTMLEMLLVLAVVAVVIAIAWPNVTRLSSQQKLNESAEKVRALAASARVHAIESGLVYQFRYEPGGRHFLVVPFEREFEGVSPTSQGTGTFPGRFSKASGTLPEGVTFAAPSLLNSLASNPAAALGQKLPAELLTGLPDAAKLETVSWSGPLLFQPDGSAADTSLDVTDKRNQRITLRVRGVTGAIGVSRLHYAERH